MILEIAGDELSLAGTAEIPLAATMLGKSVELSELPLKMVAFGHAFRTEAGKHGTATRGIYRLHQFSKVELFVYCTPDKSERFFDELVALQEEIFSELGLHFRYCRVK